MKDIEPPRSLVSSLQISDRHSGKISWGSSLLLKMALLGMGVFFVYWVGWPQPSLSPVAPPKNLGVQPSHTLPSGSAGDPDEVVSGAPLSGRNVFQPLQVGVEGEEGQFREVAAFTVDLNDGTLAELEHLPGIGPILAGRIVAHRTSHGAFRRIEDLALVPGIGKKRLEQLRPLVGVRASTMAIGIGS
ncbi:ComEA family DNA-binding protein [Nitrospira sp. T9]|uniref:ComEA family DNA-binding protein n=1 Tax=unclassified Nitrospira TaxID=2652172 RepID=UPI003F986BB0